MADKQVYAVADFRGEMQEISFKKGSKIIVLAQHDNGWWLGRNEAGKVGNFPSNYVQKSPVTASTPSPGPPNIRPSKTSNTKTNQFVSPSSTNRFVTSSNTSKFVTPSATKTYTSSSSSNNTNKFVGSSSNNTNKFVSSSNNTNKFVSTSSSNNKFVTTSSSSSPSSTTKVVTSSSSSNANKVTPSSSSSSSPSSTQNKFVSTSSSKYGTPSSSNTTNKFVSTSSSSSNTNKYGTPSSYNKSSTPSSSNTNKYGTPSSYNKSSTASSTPSSTTNKPTTSSSNTNKYGTPSSYKSSTPSSSNTTKFTTTSANSRSSMKPSTSSTTSPQRHSSITTPTTTTTPSRTAPRPLSTASHGRHVPNKPLPTPSKPLPSPQDSPSYSPSSPASSSAPPASSSPAFSLTSAPTSFLTMDNLPQKPLPKPPSKSEEDVSKGGGKDDKKEKKKEKEKGKKRQINYQPEEPKLPFDNLNKQLLSTKARRWNASIPRLTGQPKKAVVEWDFEKGNDTELAVTRGVIVEVLEATTAEWWEVRSEGKTGYVASSYLRVVEWKKPGEEDIARAAKAAEQAKYTSDDLEKNEKMRGHILQELLGTEQQYVRSLEQFLQEYEAPLVAMKKPLIKKQLIEQIFSPVKAILEVNTKVLALLEPPIQLMGKDKSIRTPNVIPPIMNGLVSMKADFEVYSKYIIDFDEVTTLVASLSSAKPKFGNFLVEATSKCKGLEFGAFFIMPVQRVPRYELLVRELIKNSIEPSSENGLREKGLEEQEVWASLQKAKKSLADIGEMVNETKREQEQYEVLLALQEQVSPPLPGLATRGRALLKQGTLQQAEFKKSTRKLTERYAFAFSDIFLICEVESTLLGSKTYHPQAVWPFKNDQISLEFPSDLATWGLPKEIYERLGCAFHVKTPFEFASFFCGSKEELAEWLAVIEPNIAHVNRG